MRQDARALPGAAWLGRREVPRRCDAREMTCSPRGTARLRWSQPSERCWEPGLSDQLRGLLAGGRHRQCFSLVGSNIRWRG